MHLSPLTSGVRSTLFRKFLRLGTERFFGHWSTWLFLCFKYNGLKTPQNRGTGRVSAQRRLLTSYCHLEIFYRYDFFVGQANNTRLIISDTFMKQICSSTLELYTTKIDYGKRINFLIQRIFSRLPFYLGENKWPIHSPFLFQLNASHFFFLITLK